MVALAPASHGIDLVLAGGRVIDPETGLDAVRNVGIDGDTITRVSTEPIEGTRSLDASGLVVAPGFIDLHRRRQNQDGYRLMALDGVTAALELELGVPDIRRFVDARRGRARSILARPPATWRHASSPGTCRSSPASSGPEGGIVPQAGPVTDEPATRRAPRPDPRLAA